MDNVASKLIKTKLQVDNIQMKLVEPHNHKVNAVERSIQIFKNKFHFWTKHRGREVLYHPLVLLRPPGPRLTQSP